MSASARISILVRDDHDREAWESVCVFDGHWNPYAALRRFLEDGEDHLPGTYRCESSHGTAVVGWTGDTIDLAA